MEAIILAGGQATRLGEAARGNPKALVPIAGHPLAEYQVSQLVRAGVERVIVSCAAGQAALFEAKLSGLGAEIVAVAEPEPLGRGGGIRFAAERREESGALFAFNGDELHDVDLAAFLEAHEQHGGAATIVVAPLQSQFGVVEFADGDRITGFLEAPRLPHWVNAGVYVLDDEALQRLPERGDHEQTTFPELAQEGKLFGFRHEGLWITVNTPKDLQRAEEYYAAHPELRPTLARNRTRSVPSAERTGGGGLGEDAKRLVRGQRTSGGGLGEPGGSPSAKQNPLEEPGGSPSAKQDA